MFSGSAGRNETLLAESSADTIAFFVMEMFQLLNILLPLNVAMPLLRSSPLSIVKDFRT